MIIPTSPLLRSEDYDSTVQSWIGRLLSPLNTFISSVTSAINGNLVFAQNILGQQKVLSFSYNSNILPLTFSQQFSGTAASLQVVAAMENGSPVIVIPAWSVSGNSIQITDLVKLSKGTASVLTTGATYSLTVRVSA